MLSHGANWDATKKTTFCSILSVERTSLNLSPFVWSCCHCAEISWPLSVCGAWSFTPGGRPGDQHYFFDSTFRERFIFELGKKKKKKVSAALKPSRMRVKCNSGQSHTAVTRHGNYSELRCPALCFHYSVQLSMHCSPSLNKHIAEWLTQRSAETNTVLYLLRVSPAVICFLFSAASTAPWCTFTMGNIPPIHVPICLFFDLVSHAPGSHCEEPKVTDGKQRFPIFWRVIVYFPRASQDRAQVAHSWAPS